MEYNNRIALVTGAANGIGRATSLMLARRGVDLVLFDISAERLREVEDEVKKLGRKVISVVCDMGEQSSIDAALEKIKDWKIDILVNNAALWRNDVGPFVKTNPESWKRRWMVNVWGLMYLTQKLLPPMLEQRWGRVINVSSVAGRYGIANMVDYSTTKGAVHSFTKALAKAAKEHGVSPAVETSLFLWEEETLRSFDLIMFDLKLIDPEKHRKFTGVPLEPILDNIKRCAALGIPLIARTPVIPGVNNSEIPEIAGFLREIPAVRRYELLPYHPLGTSKAEALGKTQTRFEIPSGRMMEELDKYAFIR